MERLAIVNLVLLALLNLTWVKMADAEELEHGFVYRSLAEDGPAVGFGLATEIMSESALWLPVVPPEAEESRHLRPYCGETIKAGTYDMGSSISPERPLTVGQGPPVVRLESAWCNRNAGR